MSETKEKVELLTLSDRLNHALNSLHVNQSELARRINVKPQVIQYLCTSNAYKSKFTYEIAEALNISSHWLANNTGPMRMIISEFDSYKVPALTQVQILNGMLDKIPRVLEEHKDWIFSTEKTEETSYAIRLQDNAMFPRFDVNTIILLNKNVAPKNSSFVLAYIQKLHCIVFRQLLIKNIKHMLFPLNLEMFKPIELTKTDKILGVMFEARWIL